jgi:hypothetical protein
MNKALRFATKRTENEYHRRTQIIYNVDFSDIKKLFIFFQTVLHAIYRLVEFAVKSEQSKLLKFCNENLVSDLKSKIKIY